MAYKTGAKANSIPNKKDIVGMTCRGKKVVAASHRNLYLEDGRKIPSKGEVVEWTVEGERPKGKARGERIHSCCDFNGYDKY